MFLTGRYSSHRLNPSADLAPILRQRLISIREAVRRGERRGDLGGKIQEIGWYPFSGCGWRFWPDDHSGTVARGDDVLESAGNNPEGTNRGTRRDDAPVSGLVQQILVDQQNRGALARQELVPGQLDAVPPPPYAPFPTLLLAHLAEFQSVQVSLLPVVALGNVGEDERVLDMCASPGSKTSMLLSVNPHFRGLVVANEYDRRRLGRLHHRMQTECDASAVVITNIDARFFPLLGGQQYDKILCDVPCSGDGMLRRSPGGWSSWTATSGVVMQEMQAAILERGIELLAPGGRLVYSTCSLNPMENEAVVARVLANRQQSGADDDGLGLERLPPLAGLVVRPGLTSWTSVRRKACAGGRGGSEATLGGVWQGLHAQNEEEREQELEFSRVSAPPELVDSLRNCSRLLPHDNDSGGFFLAVFVKPPATRPSAQQALQQAAYTSGLPTAASEGREQKALSLLDSLCVRAPSKQAPAPAGRMDQPGLTDWQRVSGFFGIDWARACGEDVLWASASTSQRDKMVLVNHAVNSFLRHSWSLPRCPCMACSLSLLHCRFYRTPACLPVLMPLDVGVSLLKIFAFAPSTRGVLLSVG